MLDDLQKSRTVIAEQAGSSCLAWLTCNGLASVLLSGTKSVLSLKHRSLYARLLKHAQAGVVSN